MCLCSLKIVENRKLGQKNESEEGKTAFVYIRAVGTADALEEDERAEDEDADGAEDVPGLATVEDPAQEEVVLLVGKVSVENRRDAVRDLTGQQNESGIRVVEFENLKIKKRI